MATAHDDEEEEKKVNLLLVGRPRPLKKLLMAFFVQSWQPG